MSQPFVSRMLKICITHIAAYCLVLFAATQAFAQDFVVVANNDLGVSEISSTDFKQMLLGKKSKWPSGERVVFCLFADEDTQAAFLKQFVNKTPMQFKSYWKRLVFTGKGRMPKYFRTKKEITTYVNAHSGAFSFVPAPGDASVKTLVVK